LESIYKIDTGSDHVAKFRGDRPRELGDYALKKKKHHEHFIRHPVTPYGRPNNAIYRQNRGITGPVEMMQQVMHQWPAG